MLGWDERADYPLFKFGADERALIHRQLVDSVPAEIHALAAESPITVDAFRAMIANQTAARFEDLDSALLELYRGKEIEIRSADGAFRGQSTTRLNLTDLIAVPRQLSLWMPDVGGRY